MPTNAEIRIILEDKLPRMTAERPWNAFCPIETLSSDMLIWEQWENVTGLEAARGLNGEPPPVKPSGLIRFRDTPGYYGERIDILEDEITRARKPGTFGDVFDITSIVARRQNELMVRYLDRLEVNIWNLMLNGTISVPAATGAVVDSRAYLRQTFTRNVSWALPATATPLADLRALKLLALGHSVDFGSGATIFINQITANQLLLNTNAADLYGRRTAGLGTFNNLTEINQLLLGDDLPKIQVYDESYLADGSIDPGTADFTSNPRIFGVPVRFIPTGSGILIGGRPNNEPVASYYQTANAQNPGNAPGPYMFIADNANEFNRVPRRVSIHHGHNGFPGIRYPSAICAMTLN
jgi:hypothetical protein